MAGRYTEEQLNTVDKSLLIQMVLNQQEQLETLTAEVRSLNGKMQLMMEQMVLANSFRMLYPEDTVLSLLKLRWKNITSVSMRTKGWTYGKGKAFQGAAPWQCRFPNACGSHYEREICQCGSAVPSGTGIQALWINDYQAEHGKLDDPSRGRIPFCLL